MLLAAALAAPTVAQAPPAALWSLQPVAAAPLDGPAAIDRHIDATLREHLLERRPRADRRTLLRRATLLLTGLPPTAAAVAEFAADARPDAFARRVDELLASTDCAEHLARRWLDLARYSDSNGLDENLAFGEAWRYRDWVIDAFLRDLPFDRFGTLQLAGDLLPADDPASIADRVVATGFLALGPRMLAEQDKEKLVLDTVDEQIDLVGRTFLGLTLGCARCHDHKFDPVPTRDYYALAGIFKSTRSFENLDHVSRWVEREIETPERIAARQQALAAAKAGDEAVQQFERECRASLLDRLGSHIGDYLRAGVAAAATTIAREAESADRTNLARDRKHWGSADCEILHTKSAGLQYADYDVVTQAGRHRLSVRLAAKESRPMRVLVDGEVRLESTLGDLTGDWFPAQQRWFDAGTLELTAGAHVLRFEGLGPHMPHLDRLMLAPDRDDVWPEGLAAAAVRNAAFAVRDPATELGRAFLAASENGGVAACADHWQTELLAAWRAHEERSVAAAAQKQPPPAVPAELAPLLGAGGVFTLHYAEQLRLLTEEQQQRRDELIAARDRDRAAVPPAPPMALCIAEGKPIDVPVHVRGSHLALADGTVPRGALSALAATLPPPAIPSGHSGRLELARWLFDARNPLTARVAVNRLWQVAFGEGLVRSESNFGVRGELPTHPALLDALAATLVADGWSLRRTLRTIVLSETWQQRADTDPHAATVDPDNRLLWRQNRQRLPAEAIRDAILAVAGTLDRTRAGTLLGIGNRAYVTNDQSNDAARYDVPRRSIYLPVIRNAMYDLFTVFDYADPSVHLEQRPQSTVALQALLLTNSPFVRDQSAAFAAASAAAATDDAARLDWVFERAFQRRASATERDAVQRWFAAAPAEQRWPGLCQTLLCANEFAFVD